MHRHPSLADTSRFRDLATAVLVVVMILATFAFLDQGRAGAAGAPSQLSFVVQPATGALVAPNAVTVAVAVEDVHGNVVTADNSTDVTLAIASGPASAVLNCGPDLVEQVASGVALFHCTVNLGGTYQLNATSAPSFTAATSNSFDVTRYLAFTTQPSASTVSNVAFVAQPVVTLTAVDGSTISGDSTTVVTLAIASGPAGATLACAGGLSKQAAAGIATFAGCKIDKAGSYTLNATASAFAPATSHSLDIVPGAPDHVAFTTQPANGALTSPTVAFVVAIEDAAGNVETADNASTITLSVNTGPGTIACDPPGLTHTVAAGAATFSCTLSAAGAYTIHAVASPVTPTSPATSNSFTVSQYVSFTTQPGGGTGGAPINPQPIVALRDATNSIISGDNTTVVTLAIASGPAGATLSCTGGLTRQVTAGVAGFSSCRIDKAGVYTLSASAATFATAVSAPLVIAVGPAARLVFTIQPGAGSAGAPLSAQPQVTIQDLGGNTVATDASPITLSVLTGSGTAGARVACPAVATVGGIADFDHCTVDRAGSGYRLVATDSVDHLTAASASFDVTFVDPLRIFGSDAVATSLWISTSEYPVDGSADSVVLARSDFYSDALAGGPLAATKHAPLLITPGTPKSGVIDPRVLTEIERVLPTGHTVYVLGGPLALAPSIDGTLQGDGYNVVRVAGKNLFGTATAIADVLGNPSTIFEATGLDFPDALSAVPAAVQVHGAILLTNGSAQAPETAAYLALHPATSRFAIGGPLAAAGADPSAVPVYGQDLYDTSAAVASTFFPMASTFGAATGATFPDALAGGVFMSTMGRMGPVLLVDPNLPLPASIEAYLTDDVRGTRGFVFGGPLAVRPEVFDAITAAVSS